MTTKDIKKSERLPPEVHKHLDLIRRLEKQSFIFDGDPKVATTTVQHSAGMPLDKLKERAALIDANGRLKQALQRGGFLIGMVGNIYAGVSFVLGFVGVFGLLSTQVVNFFYVLIGLLGWHTLTLVLWFVRLGHTPSYTIVDALLDKLKSKSAINAAAFEIYTEEFKQNGKWQIGVVIHRAWLFGLLGSLLALLMLFLFKSYAFVWESTLLSAHHFHLILSAFGSVPSLFGFDISSQSSPARLATLMMISVVIYGILPRLCAYGLCRLKATHTFQADFNLYYYEHLFRLFNQQIVDKDDFVPTAPIKPTKATISPKTKVIATLEKSPQDAFWYTFGIGHDVQDVGVVDSKEQLEQLLTIAKTRQAQICLGINSSLLPDRGVLRKLDRLHQSEYGLIVMLLDSGDQNDYTEAWREALVMRGIEG